MNFKTIGIIVAVVIGIPATVSLISTVNTVTSAPSRVVNKTLSTDNILSTYEGFFDVKSEYDAKIPQIAERQSYLASATDPAERSRLQMELSAARQSCRQLATRYNADAKKNNDSLFLDGDLPPQLDAVACEGTK